MDKTNTMALNRDDHEKLLPECVKSEPRVCPRDECGSNYVKFKYFNNFKTRRYNQPRYLCLNCDKLFTRGGKLRHAYKVKSKVIAEGKKIVRTTSIRQSRQSRKDVGTSSSSKGQGKRVACGKNAVESLSPSLHDHNVDINDADDVKDYNDEDGSFDEKDESEIQSFQDGSLHQIHGSFGGEDDKPPHGEEDEKPRDEEEDLQTYIKAAVNCEKRVPSTLHLPWMYAQNHDGNGWNTDSS